MSNVRQQKRELAAMPGSPPAGSRWHLMHTRHGHVHCELRVCSFTPLVTGDNVGAWYVKYYAIGKKHEVECRCSLAEWNDLAKRGRIREPNDEPRQKRGSDDTAT